jgi:hypothetical protein
MTGLQEWMIVTFGIVLPMIVIIALIIVLALS